MTTKFQEGDIIYFDDHSHKCVAEVVKITSTTKAQIRPLVDIGEIWNPNSIINTYRKFMTLRYKDDKVF